MKNFKMIFSTLALILTGGLYLLNGSIHPETGKESWKEILSSYVSEKGMVDYQGLKKHEGKLDRYLDHLKASVPSSNDKDNERMAYWINAYNAFTLKLILDEYPLKSIKEIEKPWDKKFIPLGGKLYSLNKIEHGILREEFDDPRIHYAVNCASFSCPILRNEPYKAENLDEQLNDQAHRFINDPKRNRISKDKLQLSKIFKWYKEDFTDDGGLIDHLNEYSKVTISKNASIGYMDYDWSLNEQ